MHTLKESFSGYRCPCRGGLSPGQGPGSVDRGSFAGWWALYLACVAGAKRGGGGGREKGKRESNPIQSSSPFSLPPYPLPPTPFDACYAGYFISYPGNRGTENKYFAIRKLKSLFSDFFNRTRNSETKFGFLNENPYLQGIRTDSWKIRGAPS